MNKAIPAWAEEYIAQQRALQGDMVPPWIFMPHTHPYSISWRMGSGESHIEAWGYWWESLGLDTESKFAYFRSWPPPPRWLAWMADAVWEREPWEEEVFDYTPYFAELERRGFGSYSEYEKDLDDPRWLDEADNEAEDNTKK